ncbi:MAG TPA: 7-carboxy-7-deazaguanine synthase QueE [Bryobacteraceae bacterium]|nr:7-carboxy-7-deazaguanine synthase QueE [Bryobacteraceae bacterium]
MKISEIFYSIQGEGTLVGVPSVFVRTSGCNLRCTWCDTPYTSWQPEGEERSVDSIVEEVNAFGASHVVITGGEPMIAPGIEELTERLSQHITIETAGTVDVHVRCDLMSISPKLANSTPHTREDGRWAAQHERLRYQPEILRRLIQLYPYQLKFVIADPADLLQVNSIVQDIGASRSRVVLMAEGTDAATLAERGRWLAEIAKSEGFRMTPRMHVDLWGTRRGV